MWIRCKEWFVKHATSTYGKVWLGILSFFESIIIPVPIDAREFIAFYSAEESFVKVQNFFNNSVFLFTFIGALTPLPYKIFVLTAGFMKVDFWVFLVASIFGRGMRLYISAWLTHKYGQQSIGLVARYSVHITVISIGVLLCYLLGYMLL